MAKPKNMTPEQEAAWKERVKKYWKKASQKYKQNNPEKVSHTKEKYRSSERGRQKEKEFYNEKGKKLSVFYTRYYRAKKRAPVEYEWFMANLMAEAENWNGEPLAAPVPIIELETRQQADAAP